MQQQDLAAAFLRLAGIMDDLREQCPWDRKQTIQSLRQLTIEETFELADAITEEDWKGIREELGDLLLHLAFQIVIAEERSQFNAEVVTRTLEEKMWRRHPNLFGEGRPSRSDHEGWELVKRREPRAGGKRGTLAGLPQTLPPLLMAYRLQERAAGIGFDWPDATGPLAKVKEEIAELERETGHGTRETTEEELGDLLFAVVNLSRKLAIEPGQALERANAKFQKRFEGVEKLAEARGLEMGRASLEELDKLWDEVKQA